MSIRFQCHRCSRPFEVSSQKAGRKLDCPQCGTRLTIPQKNGATPEPRGHAEPGDASQAPRSEIPSGMILFPRRVYYLQAMLLLTLSAAAFGLGYWIGRGDAVFQSVAQQEQTQRERIFVEGTLRWTAPDGPTLADQDAVVIAVPEELPPEKRVPIEGLRPTEPTPAADSAALRALREAGGAYGRADAEGHFSLIVPGPGNYRLLMVSRHSVRSQDIPADAKAQLGLYFLSGADLVGRCDYRWRSERIQRGFNPIEVDFRGTP